MQQPWKDFSNQDLYRETQLGLSLEDDECKNSMQSSTALARYDESLGSDNECDLTKVDEETFLEDLLPIVTTLMELATFAPSRSMNLTGDNKGSLGNLEKLQLPMTLFLFPNTPCLRNMVGFSLTSGLKLTLLLFLNIWIAIWDFQLHKTPIISIFLLCLTERKGGREGVAARGDSWKGWQRSIYRPNYFKETC